MVPHRPNPDLSLADSLFNRRLSQGRAVVENSFGLLKQTFRELHQKSDLHVAFFPDVVMSCVILHNILRKKSDYDIDRLMDILNSEDTQATEVATSENEEEVHDFDNLEEVQESTVKRRELGVFLSLQRLGPYGQGMRKWSSCGHNFV